MKKMWLVGLVGFVSSLLTAQLGEAALYPECSADFVKYNIQVGVTVKAGDVAGSKKYGFELKVNDGKEGWWKIVGDKVNVVDPILFSAPCKQTISDYDGDKLNWYTCEINGNVQGGETIKMIAYPFYQDKTTKKATVCAANFSIFLGRTAGWNVVGGQYVNPKLGAATPTWVSASEADQPDTGSGAVNTPVCQSDEVLCFEQCMAKDSEIVKVDSDGDGVSDCTDVCPYDNNLAATAETCSTGGSDAEGDSDNDKIKNSEDNCPVNYNPTQVDQDNDGMGANCDTDGDNFNASVTTFPKESMCRLDRSIPRSGSSYAIVSTLVLALAMWRRRLCSLD